MKLELKKSPLTTAPNPISLESLFQQEGLAISASTTPRGGWLISVTGARTNGAKVARERCYPTKFDRDGTVVDVTEVMAKVFFLQHLTTDLSIDVRSAAKRVHRRYQGEHATLALPADTWTTALSLDVLLQCWADAGLSEALGDVLLGESDEVKKNFISALQNRWANAIRQRQHWAHNYGPGASTSYIRLDRLGEIWRTVMLRAVQDTAKTAKLPKARSEFLQSLVEGCSATTPWSVAAIQLCRLTPAQMQAMQYLPAETEDEDGWSEDTAAFASPRQA